MLHYTSQYIYNINKIKVMLQLNEIISRTASYRYETDIDIKTRIIQPAHLDLRKIKSLILLYNIIIHNRVSNICLQ